MNTHTNDLTARDKVRANEYHTYEQQMTSKLSSQADLSCNSPNPCQAIMITAN